MLACSPALDWSLSCLCGGSTRSYWDEIPAVAQLYVNSSEFRDISWVAIASCLAALGRESAFVEWSPALAALRSGASADQLIAGLMQLPDYWGMAGDDRV